MTYDNIKIHKKTGFQPLSRRYIFGKATRMEEGASNLTHLQHFKSEVACEMFSKDNEM